MDRPTDPEPAVSVVIPTYNHRDYVLECLGSAFAQDVDGLEVIVVVDGSPDDTAELLRPLAATGRVRLIEQENRGQAAARQRGWRAARGAFVAFLDDDDRWPAGSLRWRVDALREDSEAVLVYGDFAFLERDGTLTPDAQSGFPSGDVRRAFRLRNWILSPGQALIRRSTLEAVGGLDLGLWGSDDWELFIRLADAGPFLYRPRVALHYRVHESNASRQALRHARNHLRVVRRHLVPDLPLVVRHQRLAANYFVPNLLAQARECRARREFGLGLMACLAAPLFRPGLLARPSFLRLLAALLLRVPPRRGPRA